MLEELWNPLLGWIENNPAWLGVFVFLVAMIESLVVIGLIVPGVAMMVAFGVFISAEAISYSTAATLAFLGAVAGDALSFEFGAYFSTRIETWSFFRNRPRLLATGHQFFSRHGGKSILIGRFIGPIRPIIPAIAGSMEMPRSYFYSFNIASALLWAPIVLLPGYLLGEGSEAAGNLLTQLVVGIVVGMVAVWLLYKTGQRLSSWLSNVLVRAGFVGAAGAYSQARVLLLARLIMLSGLYLALAAFLLLYPDLSQLDSWTLNRVRRLVPDVIAWGAYLPSVSLLNQLAIYPFLLALILEFVFIRPVQSVWVAWIAVFAVTGVAMFIVDQFASSLQVLLPDSAIVATSFLLFALVRIVPQAQQAMAVVLGSALLFLWVCLAGLVLVHPLLDMSTAVISVIFAAMLLNLLLLIALHNNAKRERV